MSNTNELHWEGVLSVFEPRGLLDALVLSFRLGATKPDPAFWDAAVAAAGCAPGDCLYADDRPELVAAAAARGIPGFVVSGPGTFARALAVRGLLDPDDRRPGNSEGVPGVRLS